MPPFTSVSHTPDTQAFDPYYLKVRLTSNLDTDTKTPDDFVVTGMTTVFTAPYDNNNTDWNSNRWDCPEAGIYRITGQVFVDMLDGEDKVLEFAPKLLKNDTEVFKTTLLVRIGTASDQNDDDIHQIAKQIDTLVQMSANDHIKLAFSGTGSSSKFRINGHSTNDETFLCIERVAK